MKFTMRKVGVPCGIVLSYNILHKQLTTEIDTTTLLNKRRNNKKLGGKINAFNILKYKCIILYS